MCMGFPPQSCRNKRVRRGCRRIPCFPRCVVPLFCFFGVGVWVCGWDGGGAAGCTLSDNRSSSSTSINSSSSIGSVCTTGQCRSIGELQEQQPGFVLSLQAPPQSSLFQHQHCCRNHGDCHQPWLLPRWTVYLFDLVICTSTVAWWHERGWLLRPAPPLWLCVASVVSGCVCVGIANGCARLWLSMLLLV